MVSGKTSDPDRRVVARWRADIERQISTPNGADALAAVGNYLAARETLNPDWLDTMPRGIRRKLELVASVRRVGGVDTPGETLADDLRHRDSDVDGESPTQRHARVSIWIARKLG
jgi:hypothetical protein